MCLILLFENEQYLICFVFGVRLLLFIQLIDRFFFKFKVLFFDIKDFSPKSSLTSKSCLSRDSSSSLDSDDSDLISVQDSEVRSDRASLNLFCACSRATFLIAGSKISKVPSSLRMLTHLYPQKLDKIKSYSFRLSPNSLSTLFSSASGTF